MSLYNPVYVGVDLTRRLGRGIINIPTGSVQTNTIEEPAPDPFPSLSEGSVPHEAQECILRGMEANLETNILDASGHPHPRKVPREFLKEISSLLKNIGHFETDASLKRGSDNENLNNLSFHKKKNLRDSQNRIC